VSSRSPTFPLRTRACLQQKSACVDAGACCFYLGYTFLVHCIMRTARRGEGAWRGPRRRWHIGVAVVLAAHGVGSS
jgi:hypothetical protein